MMETICTNTNLLVLMASFGLVATFFLMGIVIGSTLNLLESLMKNITNKFGRKKK